MVNRQSETLRVSLSDSDPDSDSSEAASTFSSLSTPASSFAAHDEHVPVADSSTTVGGIGHPSPKLLDSESDDVDLIREETENAGVGVGGLN